MKAIEKALKDKSNYLSGNQVPHNITTCLSQLKVCTVDEFQVPLAVSRCHIKLFLTGS